MKQSWFVSVQIIYLFLYRLIFYGTIMDLLENLTTFYKLPIIAISERLPCQYLIAERFISPFTIYGTRYIICVIAIDRFMRIKFHQDYQQKFTTFWYNFTLSVYLAFVLYQSAVAFFFFINNDSKSIPKYSVPLNIIVFSLFIGLYIKSFIILKQHTTFSRNVRSTNADIIKITKFYFILYVVSTGILFAVNISHWVYKPTFQQSFNSPSKVIDYAILDLNPTLVGIINAIANMKINRKMNEKIKSLIPGKTPKTDPEILTTRANNKNAESKV